MDLNKSDYLELYRQMVLTRLYDSKANEWYLSGKIKECVHESTGEEAITIGCCYGLRKTDQVMPALRSRGAFIGKGVPVRTALLAMAAKRTSLSMGHETSHHAVYPELGVLPGTGMVGSSISIGTGAALAIQMQGRDDVVFNFFGDGAANRGDFHEAINLAGAWKLPCIYVIENNQVSLSTEQKEVTATKKFSDRALGYGIPGYTIDGNNVLEVYEYAQRAVERARKGEGPTLLDCVTFRMRPHIGYNVDNRDKELLDYWREKCPIKHLYNYLIENNIATSEELDKIEVDMDKHMEDEFTSIQDEPAATFEDMLNHVTEEGGVL